jgi:processive 1,2-diacylglycerol beta-glucosyltransferase
MDFGVDKTMGTANSSFIVCFHADIGYGHAQAAQSIAEAIAFLNPQIRVEVRDCLDYSSPFAARMTKSLYMFTIEKFPRLWESIYSGGGWFQKASLAISRFIMVSALNRRLTEYLEGNLLTAAVCTHFFPPVALIRLREKLGLNYPVFVAITDYDAHPIWMTPGTDGYFVASAGAGQKLLAEGVPEQLVRVSGVPIAMKYMRFRPRDLARRKLKLPRKPQAVLLAGGGGGHGPLLKLLEGLDTALFNTLILVVCGRNERLRQKLEEYIPQGKNDIRIYGFVDFMDQLYDSCDLAVTKPGGLTSAELLAKGVPVVSMEIFGGQERRNLEHLQHSGGLFEVEDVPSAVEKVAELLPRKKLLLKLQRRMRRLARPDSSLLIAGNVLARLHLPPTPRKASPGKTSPQDGE